MELIELVKEELKDLQQRIDLTKRVDQPEPLLRDMWNHKQSLKRILKEIENREI